MSTAFRIDSLVDFFRVLPETANILFLRIGVCRSYMTLEQVKLLGSSHVEVQWCATLKEMALRGAKRQSNPL